MQINEAMQIYLGEAEANLKIPRAEPALINLAGQLAKFSTQ